MKEKIVLAPQKATAGNVLSDPADICIYGGAAGGGKTFGLLLEPLRYMNNPTTTRLSSDVTTRR